MRYRDGKGIDAGEVLNRIISTYNHDSVRGLGHLSVAMEGIDCITAMQFFYNHHIQDGQERSTRYQDFTKKDRRSLELHSTGTARPVASNEGGRKYAPCPSTTGVNEYYNILDYWLDGVEYFTPLVREYLKERFQVDDSCPALTCRTLDCVRYLIPMGISTNVGAIQNGREWSKWIGTLRNLGQGSLAIAIETLLRDGWEGYAPEGDVLIRHTEDWGAPVTELMGSVVIPDYYDMIGNTPVIYPSAQRWELNVDITQTYRVTSPGHREYFQHADPLLVHLYLLKHPRVSMCDLDGVGTGAILKVYNWKHEMGPLGSSGAIAIHGMADIGTLKDLNRHRSCSTFIPLLHPEGNVLEELEGSPWSMHPYLVHTPIGGDMQTYLENGYDKVRYWYKANLDNRACKNLLPHAHLTPYVFYGSPATFMTYIANLRVRPGGHMAYRLLVHAWAESIAKGWPIWAECVPPKPVVDSMHNGTSSRDEFIDRT